MPKIGTFCQKRASRRPQKASLKSESRHTALFVIFALWASGEPTEVFRPKNKLKFASKMPKMAILTSLFNIFEQIIPKIIQF